MTQITDNVQKQDIIKVLETQFRETNMQIHVGQLGLATIQAETSQLREIIKTLISADPKTGLVTITGLDLGENLGAYYHMRTTQGYITIKIQVPKNNPKITSIADLVPGATFAELRRDRFTGLSL